ncbi:hypothetical protein E4U17_003317 [Claviceps sp. LM77 group G4]|nr:hypothetical protein E4U17_003317 [Claviceps sp. LM77 group G4]KAG6075867.1 hypothetical protein E4U16_003114 [Claviceps sp. LM84 group G4]
MDFFVPRVLPRVISGPAFHGCGKTVGSLACAIDKPKLAVHSGRRRRRRRRFKAVDEKAAEEKLMGEQTADEKGGHSGLWSASSHQFLHIRQLHINRPLLHQLLADEKAAEEKVADMNL